MRTLLAPICITCMVLLLTTHGHAQGTGGVWVTGINSQTQVIEGYRQNVDNIGDIIYFYGSYAFANPLATQIYRDGILQADCSIDDLAGTFTCAFTVPTPCKKMVVEIKQTFLFGSAEWSEPVEVFVVNNNDNTCTPECDDCQKTESGGAPGSPVDVVNGKMFYSNSDLALSGPNGLRLERFYDSQSTFDKDMGYGWRHTYSHFLDLSNLNQVRYYDNHGRLIIYAKNHTGVYDEDWFFGTTLKTITGGYEIKTWRKTIYRFDSSGKLTTIIDRKGNTITLSYDGSNRLSVVTDAFGKTLTFSYPGAATRVQSVTTSPDSRVISFSYDANNNLRTYTDAVGKLWTYEYAATDVHNLTSVIDPLGHTVESHTYFANDKAQSSSKQGGQESLSFSYGAGTTSATDSLARTTTYTWDSNLKVITQVSGPACGCRGNQSRTYTWDNFLRQLSETDAKGNQTKYEWLNRTINNQSYPTLKLSFVRRAFSSGVQQNTQYTNYYAAGTSRDDLFQTEIAKSVDTPVQNRTITYSYDTVGNLTSRQISGYSNSSLLTFADSFTYNAHGQMLTHNGPRIDVSDINTYSYFPDGASNLADRGQVNTITDALAQTLTKEKYDVYGNAKKITEISGTVTEEAFDGLGRIVTRSIKADANYAFDLVTQNVYQDDGLVDYIIHPEGNVTDFTYDSQYRQVEVQQRPSTSGFGDKLVYQYDTEGNKTREEYYRNTGGATWVLKRFTDFAFDNYNRLWKTIYPNTSYKENLYDLAGNVQYVDDGNHAHGGPNHQYTFAYDPLNRLSSATVRNNAVNEATTYGYDTDDNVTAITDADGRAHSEKFDDFGRNIRTVSVDSGTTTRTFDPAGNLVTETDARPITSTRTYDALNRNLSVTYPNSSYNISFTYDAPSTPYGVGRPTGMTDESGTTTYAAYDRQGILVKEQKIINSVTYTTQYSYNKNNRLTMIKYPSGRQVTYDINATNERPQSITADINGITRTLLSNIGYLPFGVTTGSTLFSGLTVTRSYDNKYMLSSNTVNGSVLSLNYTPDNEGNFTAISDTITPANNKSFTFDDRYQLLTATGPWGTESYTYDKNGNRLSKTLGVSNTTYNYTAGTNRLTSTTGSEPAAYTYDASANNTADGLHNYGYGDHNRLSSVDVTAAQYKYDGRDLRIKKILPTETTVYFYNQMGLLLSERDLTTGLFKDYVYLDAEPVARIDGSGAQGSIGNFLRCTKSGSNVALDWTLYPGSENFVVKRSTAANFSSSVTLTDPPISGKTYNDPVLFDGIDYFYNVLKTTNNDVLLFYHGDHLRTPVAITNSSGSVVWRAEYMPFGSMYSQTGTATNNLRFLGQYADAETNQSYNEHRTYNPKIGRYTQIDPAGMDSYDTNLYGYAQMNPIAHVDPNGLIAVTPANPGTCACWNWPGLKNSVKELCNKDRKRRVKKSDCLPDALKDCLDKKCNESFEIKCDDDSGCGSSNSPGGSAGAFTKRSDAGKNGVQKPGIQKITLCPGGMSGENYENTGSVGAIVFHEATHLCGFDLTGNRGDMIAFHTDGNCAACAAYPDAKGPCASCHDNCIIVGAK